MALVFCYNPLVPGMTLFRYQKTVYIQSSETVKRDNIMKKLKTRKPKHKHMNKTPLAPVVANKEGEIFELEGFGAAAMAGDQPVLLTQGDTIEMPYGSEMMMLPDRFPLVFNFDKFCFEILKKNPYNPEEPIHAVSVFNSPGYVNRYVAAYESAVKGALLPLFSYGATGWGKGGFRSAAICVDRERRQDLRLMPRKGIEAGVKAMQKKYPDNRLMRHLEKCALLYSCPAAKNFFLGRFEAPLPTSQVCNANCMGCISLQKTDNLAACQDRISFTPEPHEIAQVCLEHIPKVKKSVVSFGQGCEGDPLTAFHVIAPAIRQVREETDQGTINMNTNAGMPHQLEKLFDAGLDSLRVSMNSVRETCYTTYFRPKSYTFQDVVKSFEIAEQKQKFISINYLNCPGVTDSEQEFEVLNRFLSTHRVNMIQWRNLNYDPLGYFKTMETAGGKSPALGMEFIIHELSRRFPHLIHGYFNPPVR